MECNNKVRNSDAILSDLRKLRSDPNLQQHLINPIVTSQLMSIELETTTPITNIPEKESFSTFQARWSHEEELRLKQSMKAQRTFQEALNTLENLQKNNNIKSISNNINSNSNLTRTPLKNVTDTFTSGSTSNSIEIFNEKSKGVPSIDIKINELITIQDKLELKDRTIQRLQNELDETRNMYESEISRIQEENLHSRREMEKELIELQEYIKKINFSIDSPNKVQKMDSNIFLEVMEFKERMLQEMHEAFQQASEKWKNNTMHSMIGLKATTEKEIDNIVSRAELLIQQLEVELSSKIETNMNTNIEFTSGKYILGIEELLKEESFLLSSYEEKLRLQIRTAVKDAVQIRVKEVIKPILESELMKHRNLYLSRCASPTSPEPIVKTIVGGTEKRKSEERATISGSSPAEVRYEETLSLFQKLVPKRREISTGSVATALLDDLSRGVSEENKTTNHSGRLSWLNRYCY